ncbi:MAG: hypothetical protein EHM80_04865 [Nitrospiraceae bacterium]|nr:MAG: hypothetical protein EHM80_04865 [Nitrospiraceae bacterium]
MSKSVEYQEEAGFPEGMTYDSLFGKKPRGTKIHLFNLRKLFPPDDEFATCIARLCILREDLSMEIKGIAAGPFGSLDANTIAWRHNYFFRNSARTLREIASALQRLRKVPEFQRALQKKASTDGYKAFEKFCTQMQDASGLIGELRNSIGGHVKHNAVAKGLKLINDSDNVFWERPIHRQDRLAHTHHPFVSELFIAILQAGDRADNMPPRSATEMLEIPGVLAKLIRAIPHIDSLFELYVSERQLL